MEYIQEDLGDGQLFELLKPQIPSGEFTEEQLNWLKDTMSLLPAVQFKVGERMDWSICFPDREFNDRMVSFDLNYFKYDFLKLTGLEFDEIRLQDDLDRLRADSLDYDSNCFMYRDFQARNIIIKDGEPCFIDFQGGRRGPVQYDLASFLHLRNIRIVILFCRVHPLRLIRIIISNSILWLSIKVVRVYIRLHGLTSYQVFLILPECPFHLA